MVTEANLLAVVRVESEHQRDMFYCGPESILNLTAIVANHKAGDGQVWAFFHARQAPPDVCPDCGAAMIAVTEENKSRYESDEEPHTRAYECGRLVFKSYGDAAYALCKPKNKGALT